MILSNYSKWIKKSDFENITFNPVNKSDSHYFDKTDYDSKYLHVNEINTFKWPHTAWESLSLLHLNIRSLRSNLDDFHTLLEESKHSFKLSA